MTHFRLPGSLFVFVVLMISGHSLGQAAEVRGRMLAAGKNEGPPSASVVVICPENEFTVPIAKNGDYGVRGIESGASCTIQVKLSGLASKKIPFNMDRPVVRINGEVMKVGDKLILLLR